MSMIVYILKVSVSLALFWLMYRLVFKNRFVVLLLYIRSTIKLR